MSETKYRPLKVPNKIKLWWADFQIKLYRRLAEKIDNLTSTQVYVSLPSPVLCVYCEKVAGYVKTDLSLCWWDFSELNARFTVKLQGEDRETLLKFTRSTLRGLCFTSTCWKHWFR